MDLAYIGVLARHYWLYILLCWILFMVLVIFYFWYKGQKLEKVPVYTRESPFYVYVRETKRGLETLASRDLNLLEEHYKEQIKSFLENIILSMTEKKASFEKPDFIKKAETQITHVIKHKREKDLNG